MRKKGELGCWQMIATGLAFVVIDDILSLNLAAILENMSFLFPADNFCFSL
jgi:hypothetical protein